ncbi:MAG: AMP-binding protein [Christensenellales bacterium]|jgi:long-chain acyl-CoA synthetase
MRIEAPWLSRYRGIPHSIDYPEGSMADMLEETARRYPDYIAYDFMGTTSTYRQLWADTQLCAKGLAAIGVTKDDRVTVCLPNMPQTVIIFYAINLLGAVANMIHPLSSEGEIEFFLKDADSRVAITLDAFYSRFAAMRRSRRLDTLILTGVKDYLSPLKKLGFAIKTGRKMQPVPKDADVVYWKDLMEAGKGYEQEAAYGRLAQDVAAILYSGGTTGSTKGILLTNLNFNALGMQTVAMGQCVEAGGTMLAVLPMFHGFGLGICIHCMMISGCKCILIPKFTPDSFADLVRKKRPNYIAGVPTLYEAMLRNETMEDVDLSCLKGVFVGGDSMSVELKRRFDAFLQEHHSSTVLREGYGTTECVTASCLTPSDEYREGSIGLPFPDTLYKIVQPQTIDALPYRQEGEICISGPTVMKGYVNQPEETANALRKHDDGRIWLHTGDLGMMDEDGFVYFRQRLKRMIISSGYSIYPSQLENVLDAHPQVSMSCVVGVPDDYRVQKVKAFVVLKKGVSPSEALREDILQHCRKHIAKYAMPYDIEFRESLPQTKVGKIAYTILEAEEKGKYEREKALGPGDENEDVVDARQPLRYRI